MHFPRNHILHTLAKRGNVATGPCYWLLDKAEFYAQSYLRLTETSGRLPCWWEDPLRVISRAGHNSTGSPWEPGICPTTWLFGRFYSLCDEGRPGYEGQGLDCGQVQGEHIWAGARRTHICFLCLLWVETLEPLCCAKYQGDAVCDGGWTSCLLDWTPWS